MQITGQHDFTASPDEVWAAICDPSILKSCIAQCEEIRQLSATEWHGSAKVKIGPLGVPFKGIILLSNVVPATSYTINITATSWVGTSHGSADVSIAPGDKGTTLAYTANVAIGIKMLDKAMGLASDVANRLAISFFNRLNDEIIRRRSAL